MKRLVCLFLLAALACPSFAAVGDVQQALTAEPETESAENAQTLSPMELTGRAPVYQAETGKIAGYAYSGLVIVPTDYQNERYYFRQAVVGGTRGYYIHARYLSPSEFAGEPSPLSISGDVLTLKKGAKLFSQTGELLYTVRIPPAPFYYTLVDDKGYNFVFGARYVYVSQDQATAGSPGEVMDAANTLEGIIATVYGSDSFLMSVTSNNMLENVVINYSDATLPKTKLNSGDGVRVVHDGFMTAQETPVIKALQLTLVEAAELKRGASVLRGVVEAFDGSMLTLAVENSARFDKLSVDCSKAGALTLKPGAYVEVEVESVVSGGATPLVRAASVAAARDFSLTGSITQLVSNENAFLMSTADYGEVKVIYDGAKMPKMSLAPGLNVTVAYDGKMTRSIPPQITAQEVLPA